MRGEGKNKTVIPFREFLRSLGLGDGIREHEEGPPEITDAEMERLERGGHVRGR